MKKISIYLFIATFLFPGFFACNTGDDKGDINDCVARQRLIVAGGSVYAPPYHSGDSLYLDAGTCVESCENSKMECHYSGPDGCDLLMQCLDGDKVDVDISGQWELTIRKCY